MLMDLEEYRSRGPDDPFVYEVERWGRVLYEDPESERQRALKLVGLAERAHQEDKTGEHNSPPGYGLR